MYADVIESLKAAYDGAVEARARGQIEDWKVIERNGFLELLRREGKLRLLEVGAGTGVHGAFFRSQGIEVVCTDLSPQMVAHCRSKGLTAYVMDFMSLSFAEPFQAAFAMNCLLHVPKPDLGAALAAIQAVLEPGGLFYLGQYGGQESEGTRDEDTYEPKRFFSSLTDEQLQEAAGQHFDIVDFRQVAIGREDRTYFQALTLRRPG